MLLFSLTIYLTLKSKFKSNKVRITVFAVGFLLSVGVSVGFSSTVNEALAGVTLYVAIVYFTFMMSFVREYVTLVSKHLTQKEAHARRKTAKEYCLKDELKGGPMTFSASVRAHYEFFMVRQIPFSNFPQLH